MYSLYQWFEKIKCIGKIRQETKRKVVCLGAMIIIYCFNTDAIGADINTYLTEPTSEELG
jgi:hypothetical protein